MSVDFPEPFGPRRATISPGLTSNEIGADDRLGVARHDVAVGEERRHFEEAIASTHRSIIAK